MSKEAMKLHEKIAAAVLDHCYGQSAVSDDMIAGTAKVISQVMAEQPAPVQQEEGSAEYWASKYPVPLGYELVKKNPQPAQQDHDLQVLAKSYIAEDEAATSNIGTLMNRGRKMADAILKAAPQPAQRKQVGDSRFESWYSEDFDPKGKGTKQQMREAYEAGMNDTSPPAQWQKVECPICGDMAIATDIPPAQRKPLTDEQIASIAGDSSIANGVIQFARAIEAAHGIKENT